MPFTLGGSALNRYLTINITVSTKIILVKSMFNTTTGVHINYSPDERSAVRSGQCYMYRVSKEVQLYQHENLV